MEEGRRKDGDPYPQDIQRWLYLIYIIALVTWIILIFVLGLYEGDIFGWVILVIPFVVFLISMYNIPNHSVDVENNMFEGNFLSFAFLLVVIFVNWRTVSNNVKIFRILMVALVLLMLSLVDVWVDINSLSLLYHIRSILQTIALTLLAYTLYTYYLEAVLTEHVHPVTPTIIV